MRLILIDNASGYIFGDTADFAANQQSDITDIVDAARMLDESLGECGRRYTAMRYSPRSSSPGYGVYRADVDGAEAVPVVLDGQDWETIEAVMRGCAYQGFVLCEDAA